VLLAKRLGRYFLDTDVFIQAVSGRSLQEIIDSEGLENFCQLEAEHILGIDRTNCVIATGGSAIYSEEAMNHLKQSGRVVHLNLPLDMIRKRLTNLNGRGVVINKGKTLDDLYNQRTPLYRKWADVTIDCCRLTHEQVVEKIVDDLKAFDT
jgi:shikimate kinase